MITSKPLCQDQLKKYNPDYVLYRDKENEDYKTNAKGFISVCREVTDTKCFLHQDVVLAHKLKADGVHLTSLQFEEIEYAKEKGLEVIISTHSLDEVQKAEVLGADFVTYSPIFATPNKGEPKGVEDLKKLVDCVDIKVFALGGITTKDELEEIQDSGVYGFASIRYFE